MPSASWKWLGDREKKKKKNKKKKNNNGEGGGCGGVDEFWGFVGGWWIEGGGGWGMKRNMGKTETGTCPQRLPAKAGNITGEAVVLQGLKILGKELKRK